MSKATLSLLFFATVLFSSTTFAAEVTSISSTNSIVASPSTDEVTSYVLNKFDAIAVDIERILGTENLLVTCEGGRIFLLEVKGDVIISGNEIPNQ